MAKSENYTNLRNEVIQLVQSQIDVHKYKETIMKYHNLVERADDDHGRIGLSVHALKCVSQDLKSRKWHSDKSDIVDSLYVKFVSS